jgi:hypothetical protein
MKKIVFTLLVCSLIISSDAQETFLKTYPFYSETTHASLVFAWEDGYTAVVFGKKDKYYLSVIRTDLNGDTIWTRDHDMGIPSNWLFLKGTSDNNGNIYIKLIPAQNTLVKIDSDGNVVWSKNYPFIVKMIQYSNNYLWAIMNFNTNLPNGYYLYKIYPLTGDTLWRSQAFGSDGHPGSMAIKQNGEIVITSTHPVSGSDWTFVKINTLAVDSNSFVSTNLPGVWDAILYDSEYIGDELYSVGCVPSFAAPYDHNHYYTYLTDGTILKSKMKSFGCLSSSSIKFVINNENQIVVLGRCWGYPLLYGMTLNWDSIWLHRYFNLDSGVDIKLCDDGGYIISGSIYDTIVSRSIPCLLKINSEGILTGINGLLTLPSITVYPNPATELVTFKVHGTSDGTIAIYNVFGQFYVSIKIHDGLALWNTTDIRKGVYIYSYMIDNQIRTGKIIIN